MQRDVFRAYVEATTERADIHEHMCRATESMVNIEEQHEDGNRQEEGQAPAHPEAPGANENREEDHAQGLRDNTGALANGSPAFVQPNGLGSRREQGPEAGGARAESRSSAASRRSGSRSNGETEDNESAPPRAGRRRSISVIRLRDARHERYQGVAEEDSQEDERRNDRQRQRRARASKSSSVGPKRKRRKQSTSRSSRRGRSTQSAQQDEMPSPERTESSSEDSGHEQRHARRASRGPQWPWGMSRGNEHPFAGGQQIALFGVNQGMASDVTAYRTEDSNDMLMLAGWFRQTGRIGGAEKTGDYTSPMIVVQMKMMIREFSNLATEIIARKQRSGRAIGQRTWRRMIKKGFEKNGVTTGCALIRLRGKFTRMPYMSKRERVNDLYKRWKKYFDAITFLYQVDGKALTSDVKQQFTAYFINALPSEWQQSVVVQLALEPQNYKRAVQVATVIEAQIPTEEPRPKERQVSSCVAGTGVKETTGPSGTEAMTKMQQQMVEAMSAAMTRVQQPRSGITCFGCGLTGHMVRECPNKGKSAPQQGANNGDPRGNAAGGGACFRCGEHGHFARECTKPVISRCPRCNPPCGLPLSQCPRYGGCQHCGSRSHLGHRCPQNGGAQGAQAQPQGPIPQPQAPPQAPQQQQVWNMQPQRAPQQVQFAQPPPHPPPHPPPQPPQPLNGVAGRAAPRAQSQ